MIHQPSGGAQGMASDIEIQAQRDHSLEENLNRSLCHSYRPEIQSSGRAHGS